MRLNRITGGGTLGTGYSGAGYQNLTIGLGGGSSTFSGSITNTDNNPSFVGNLVKEGAGTIILTGANTYSGTTTINGGTLQLGTGAAGQDGALSNTSGITNNAALAFNLAGTSDHRSFNFRQRHLHQDRFRHAQPPGLQRRTRHCQHRRGHPPTHRRPQQLLGGSKHDRFRRCPAQQQHPLAHQGTHPRRRRTRLDRRGRHLGRLDARPIRHRHRQRNVRHQRPACGDRQRQQRFPHLRRGRLCHPRRHRVLRGRQHHHRQRPDQNRQPAP